MMKKTVISRALLGNFWASIDEKSNTIVELFKREVPEGMSIEGVRADLMAVTQSEGLDLVTGLVWRFLDDGQNCYTFERRSKNTKNIDSFDLTQEIMDYSGI